MKFIRSLVMLGLAGGLTVVAATAATAAPVVPAVVEPATDFLDTWAWCGVDPALANAAASVKTLAEVAGIDVTFGPCNEPTLPYSPAETGDRYSPPATYRQLVDLNASVGIKTAVYDKRLWDPDPVVRATALDFWAPVYDDIAVWDLGDEFDPDGPEWPILVSRWNLVLAEATSRSGVRPFSNHRWHALNKALTDLPGSDVFTSFDKYVEDKGNADAREFSPQVQTLMCAVNAFDHFGLVPTPASIRGDMEYLRDAGCDALLVFGGQRVYGTDNFGLTSLVTATGQPTSWAAPVLEGARLREPAAAAYVAVQPARLLESRVGSGLSTVDGQMFGFGPLGAGTTTELVVAGRGGLPNNPAAAVINVTVTEAATAGYITVYPCGENQPNAASVTFSAGATVSNAVVAKVGAGGKVCIFTSTTTQVVVDVNGFYPSSTSYQALQPARILDSRSGTGIATVDGRQVALGLRGGGSVTELQVTGRAGVPFDATSAVLNVTVTEPQGAGYLTLYPCGDARPLAASVTYSTGATVSNLSISKIGWNGRVCIYTQTAAQLVVDIGGYAGSRTRFAPQIPARVLETRTGTGAVTADGQSQGLGIRSTGTVTELPITGRVGVPANATAVVLNVTATESTAPGYLTVYPCGEQRPNAANLSFDAGATVANAVVAKVGQGGKVCIYTFAPTQLVVDVTGWYSTAAV